LTSRENLMIMLDLQGISSENEGRVSLRILAPFVRLSKDSTTEYEVVLATTCWRIGRILQSPDLPWGVLH